MRFLAPILLMLCLALPAAAEVPLIFRDSAKGPREQELLTYLWEKDIYDRKAPFTMTATDLNGDGVEEWIFRQNPTPNCESNADCAFSITGLSKGNFTVLGQMRGGKIGVSGEKQYGVRKLLVYNEKNDDFAYQIYVWMPGRQAFLPE
jgi:hypothetical protein